MDRDYLAELCDARDTLCGFCTESDCEKCMVQTLINNAHNMMSDEDADSE